VKTRGRRTNLARVAAFFGLAIGLGLACTPTSPAPIAAQPPASSTSASSAIVASASSTSAAPGVCQSDDDCSYIDPSEAGRVVCEAGRCESWGKPQLVTWANAQLPALTSHPPPPTFANAKWLDGQKTVTLFVDARALGSKGAPAKCDPLQLARQDDALVGLVPMDYGKDPAMNGVGHYTLTLKGEAVLTGPSWESKTSTGENGAAIGKFELLGRHLQLPLDDALLYRGMLVKIEVGCSMEDLERDARCPSCVRCARFREEPRSLDPNSAYGFGPSPTVKMTSSSAPPACIECPKGDPMKSRLPRFAAAIEDLVTVMPAGPAPGVGPGFFRTLFACEADRKAREKKP
jgi:hypothetical protein